MSGRIQLYFRKDELGDDAFAHARSLRHRRRGRRRRGRCSARARAKSTVRGRACRAARQVAASAAVRQGRDRRRRDAFGTRDSAIPSSGIASGTPISRCIPRCARCFVARSRMIDGDSRVPRRARLSRGGDAGAAAAVWRRDGAAVRRRTTTRSTCRSICASRTSCISSGWSWAASTGCTRSATTFGTRASTGRTIPSSRCSSSTRRTRTTT